MKVMAQLAFGGNCREAFELYERVLGGTIVVMNTFGANQDKPLPSGSTTAGDDKVRFAELRWGEQSLLGNDVPADQFEPMRGFNVSIHADHVDEATRIFQGLAEGGRIATPLEPVAWAALFGMVTDRFGVPWLVLATGGAADQPS